MRNTRLIAIGFGMLYGGMAAANNGDQMVGYSALSNAMGGAVVATPQDVTTALSNPAGLAFLNLGEAGTRFDMNLAVLNPIRELNGVESDNDAYIMATGGFAFQSELFGDDVTIGVGAYPISGGGVDFPNRAFAMPVLGNMSIVATRQSLRIGPAVAVRLNDKLALGVNVSLASNQMSLKGPTGSFPTDVAYGVSGVAGVTYEPTPGVRLGASYTTRSYSQDLEWNLNDGQYRLSFEDPQTVAVGISYQPSQRWLMELDVKWLDYEGVRSSNILYGPTPAQDRTLAYGWESQWVVGLGTKYRVSDRTALLAGYNYGASPLGPEDVNQNIGATAIVEHHVSFGAEFRVTRLSTLTLSVIHGFENDMTSSVGLPTDVSFETNLATLQFTYRH
ncbi:MAG: OmpP1/FadL family transporter [Pseudomonadota bacterium]